MAQFLVVRLMSAQLLAERGRRMIPGYMEMFAKRGGVTPINPLKFHFYHLARYWSRLVVFCRHNPSKPEGCIDGDLGACVQVGSEFADKLIDPASPIYASWRKYWTQTQIVLHRRPVTIEAVEAASQAFDDCVAGLKYDPWA